MTIDTTPMFGPLQEIEAIPNAMLDKHGGKGVRSLPGNLAAPYWAYDECADIARAALAGGAA